MRKISEQNEVSVSIKVYPMCEICKISLKDCDCGATKPLCEQVWPEDGEPARGADAADGSDPYPLFPAELKAYERWCVYKFVWNEERQKYDKPPYNARTHHKGNPTEPGDRSTFTAVVEALKNPEYQGAGFGLDYSDGFTCTDFDNCVKDGKINITVQKILDEVHSYAEFSPSGDGVHLWTQGWQVPNLSGRQGCKVGRAEMYSGKHYLTVTGKHIAGTPPRVEHRNLSELYERIIKGAFKDADTYEKEHIATGDQKKSVQIESDDNRHITTKMQMLMHGNIIPGSRPFVVSDDYGHRVQYSSQSEADQALCTLLAIEGYDAEKIDEEFRSSVLYREKWERADYSENTIKRALESAAGIAWRSPVVEVISDLGTQPDALNVIDIADIEVTDMPESVLCGRLGEIYRKRLNVFPIAYGWHSLVTAASVLVPPLPPPQAKGLVIANEDDSLTNLYTALVGPVHSGKSQSVEWGAKVLNIYNTPHYTETKAGSAEGLFKRIQNERESKRLLDQIQLNVDEWSHFFAKARIDGASFSLILSSGFYKRKQSLVIAGGREIEVDCLISWIGGIVTDQYEDCFNTTTTGGLYDRFAHGLCPTGYTFDYVPFEGGPEHITPVPVTIHPSVWEVTGGWRRENPELGREIELAVRVAKICASMDGREVLTGHEVELHKSFMDYQFAVRKWLKPNAGDNPDAVFSNAVISWLSRHASDGKWVRLRDLKRGTSHNRKKLGPGVADRAINNLVRFGEVEVKRIKPDGAGRPGDCIRLK